MSSRSRDRYRRRGDCGDGDDAIAAVGRGCLRRPVRVRRHKRPAAAANHAAAAAARQIRRRPRHWSRLPRRRWCPRRFRPVRGAGGAAGKPAAARRHSCGRRRPGLRRRRRRRRRRPPPPPPVPCVRPPPPPPPLAAAAAAGDHFVDVDSAGPSLVSITKLPPPPPPPTAGRCDARAADDDLELRAGLQIDVAARHRAEPAGAAVGAAAALRAVGRDVVIAGGLDREGLDLAGIGEGLLEVRREDVGGRPRPSPAPPA